MANALYIQTNVWIQRPDERRHMENQPIECRNDTSAMPSRKRLNHRGPLSIDISSAWYFITICAEGHRPWVMQNPDGRAGAPRTPNPPTFESIADMLLQHAREYHEMGKWRLSLFLVMPDHLHLIVHVPCGVRGAPAVPHSGVRISPERSEPRSGLNAGCAPALPIRDFACIRRNRLMSSLRSIVARYDLNCPFPRT